MIRTMAAVSAFALMAGAALAQDPAPVADQASDAAMQAEPSSAMSDETTPDIAAVTTKDDVKKFGEAEFKAADANGDGKIDQAEFVSYAMANMQSSVSSDDSATAEGDADTSMASADDDATPEKAFASLSNGKETISLKQYVSALVKDFEKADANKDQKLDDGEKQQFAEIVRGRTAS